VKLTRILSGLFLLVLVLQFGTFGQVSGSKPGFTIAGIAVDNHSGQPLANTTVSIAGVKTQTDSRSVVTGSDGRFQFAGLPAGKYSLVGKRHGYHAQAFDQHEQYSSAIAVGTGQDASHLVFRLHPDAAIRGRIVDESDEPVPQMQIWLFSTRNNLGRRSTRRLNQTMSNDLGEYSFAHLEEGTYYLLAMGRPWYSERPQTMHRIMRNRNAEDTAPVSPEHQQIVEQEDALLDKAYPLTFFDNATDWTQASGIDLGPGDRFTADFRVMTVPSASIRWNSPTTEQSPNRGRSVRVSVLARVFDDELVPVHVNYGQWQNGWTSVSGIAPGRYVVQVRGEDTKASTQELDISGDMDIPATASSNGAAVSGKFVWEGAPATRGFAVRLTNSRTNRNYFCMPKPDGEFTVAESVLPGKYEVAVSSQQGEVYVKSVEVAGATSTSAVQINEGAEVNLTITLARGTGTIEGVALLDGKPTAGVMVVLVPADDWVGTARFRRDQADSDGTFTLSNVVPGKYRVVALREGWKLPWSDPKTMQSFLTEGTPVQIAASEKTKISVKVK